MLMGDLETGYIHKLSLKSLVFLGLVVADVNFRNVKKDVFYKYIDEHRSKDRALWGTQSYFFPRAEGTIDIYSVLSAM